MQDPFNLEGKIALITGSSQGIGKGIAEILAARGCHVIVSSRKQEKCEVVAQAIRTSGNSAEAFACHIGKLEAITAIYDHIKSKHGHLDILVNNAVLSPWRSIDELEPSLFDKTVSVNLRGYWYMSVGAVPLMTNRGSIINISSITAMHPGYNLALYSTLKTALTGMSRSFGLEYGHKGIRVNTILPGLIDTDLANAYSEEQKNKIIKAVPMKRLGLPEDIANAIVFLASDASSYITGADLVIDGGLTISSGTI